MKLLRCSDKFCARCGCPLLLAMYGLCQLRGWSSYLVLGRIRSLGEVGWVSWDERLWASHQHVAAPERINRVLLLSPV
jgi:hypothetical protein